MRPADLLDPATLPDDLQWLAAEYRLQPNDPVFLVLAWHWHRAQKSEDALRLATMEFKAALDARFDSMAEGTGRLDELNSRLLELQEALESKTPGIAQRLEAALQKPVEAAISDVQQLHRTLVPLLQTARAAQRQQTFAALLVGLVLGATASAWILL